MEELQLVRVDVLRSPTVVYAHHLLDLVPRHCLWTINWMFSKNTVSSPSLLRSRIFSACCITSPDASRLWPQCWLFDTRLFALISLWNLACSWHCPCPCVGTALFMPAVGTVLHGSSGPIPGCFCPSRPSVPRASVHISRRRLRSGYSSVLPARAAYFFFCLFPG